MIKIALYLPTRPNAMWKLGRQLGVDYAVVGLPRREQEDREDAVQSWDFTSLLRMKKSYEDVGYQVAGIEASPPMGRIRLGLPGRDAEIENVCEMLTNMGAVGIDVWCYNFMAVFNWTRTSVTTPTRGGALVTSYDHSWLASAALTQAGVVTEERLWENYEYFMRRVVPVAEKVKVKLALHPDDPPISPIRGVSRIFRSLDAFKRAIELVPSDYNGITFCQGCFAEMGANIPGAIRYFGERHKMFFAHFRNVRGTAARFEETFHDEGDTDMLEAMRTYRAVGFDGPMRPDHVPTMEGDGNDSPGYTDRGRLFAIGYMKGLLEGVNAGL